MATAILIHLMVIVFTPVLATGLGIKVVGKSGFEDVPEFHENFWGFVILIPIFASAAVFFRNKNKKLSWRLNFTMIRK